ncbi:MAG TPA: acyloxyacyl hydrolase [Longimicrobiales bacterium]
MAKAGGRRKAAARLFVPLLAGTLALGAALPARGQRLELRGGIALSSALAREGGGSGGSGAALGAAAAPALGLALLVPLRPRTQLEAGLGWTFSQLSGSAGGESWRAGSLGVAQALVGVRWSPARGPYLRAGAGAVHYSAPREGIFSSGSSLEPALEAGAGWQWRAGGWTAGLELAGQLHAFQTQALRDAGAASGGVRRLQALLTLSRAVKR